MERDFNFFKRGVTDADMWSIFSSVLWKDGRTPESMGRFEPEPGDGPFVEIQDGWIMAHLLHHAGLFPSVTQAKKNGWDKPIPSGFDMFVVGKKKITITIWNPSDVT